MTPRSPLPQLDGLDASWLRTPGANDPRTLQWETMRDFLMARLPAKAEVASRLAAGEFADDAGLPITGDEPFRPDGFVWFHRPRAYEVPVPEPLVVLEQTERFVVVDKPHFLATTPRGAHVQETALVRLRTMLDLPELAPAHRLDRLTAGVLVFTTERRWRGAYQGVFQAGGARKVYEALAPHRPELGFPMTLTGRIEKRRDSLQAELVPGEANATTVVELAEVRGGIGRYRLTPLTGKTHQLRLHMCSIGLPLLGDSLYPEALDVPAGDFGSPLQLVARSLAFTDPVDGVEREFVSGRQLHWPDDDGRIAP